MTLTILVYLAGVMGKLQTVLFIMICLLCFSIPVVSIFANEISNFKKLLKTIIISAAVAGVAFSFIPSERTMYVTAGAYAVQAVAENPDVQRVSGKVLKIIDQKLDGVIEDGLKASK